MSLLVGLIINIQKSPSADIPHVLMGVIGSGVGLILWPTLLTYVIKGANRMVRSNFSESAFLSTFSLIWLLFAISQFMAPSN